MAIDDTTCAVPTQSLSDFLFRFLRQLPEPAAQFNYNYIESNNDSDSNNIKTDFDFESSQVK